MRRALLGICFTLVLAGAVGRASAQERVAGPFKFDVKFGPSIGIIDNGGTQFRWGMHFGVGLVAGHHYRLYLDLPLDLGFGNGYTTLLLIPGIEADIQLVPGIPLYIYPMAGLGLGFLIPSCRNVGVPFRGNFCDTDVALGLRFGAGIKYVL